MLGVRESSLSMHLPEHKSKPPVKLVVCSGPIRAYLLWLHSKECTE